MKKILVACLTVATLGALSFAVSLEGAANVYFLPSAMSTLVNSTSTERRGSVGMDLSASVLFPLSSSTELGGTVGLGLGIPLKTTVTPKSTSSDTTTTLDTNGAFDWTVFNAGPAIILHFDKPFLNKEISMYISPGLSFQRRINMPDEDNNLNLWAFYVNAALRLWLSEDKTFGISAGVNYNLLLSWFKSATHISGSEWKFFVGVVYNINISGISSSSSNGGAVINPSDADIYDADEPESASEVTADEDEYIEADSKSRSNAEQSAEDNDDNSAADSYAEAESGSESGADTGAGTESGAVESADTSADDTEQSASEINSRTKNTPDIY